MAVTLEGVVRGTLVPMGLAGGRGVALEGTEMGKQTETMGVLEVLEGAGGALGSRTVTRMEIAGGLVGGVVAAGGDFVGGVGAMMRVERKVAGASAEEEGGVVEGDVAMTRTVKMVVGEGLGDGVEVVVVMVRMGMRMGSGEEGVVGAEMVIGAGEKMGRMENVSVRLRGGI